MDEGADREPGGRARVGAGPVPLSLLERVTRQLSLRVPLRRQRLRLPRGVLSVTFDDFPKSAWEVGGAVLAGHGVRATYYACGGLCGGTTMGLRQYDPEDLQAVHAAGHEIGCHTYHHASGHRVAAGAYAASMERNQRFLASVIPGLLLRSFAYPYGHAPLPHRRGAADAYATCRGVGGGMNGPVVERSLLAAVGLGAGRRRGRGIGALVDNAAEGRGWLILLTHDVGERPSEYGCTPAELDEAVSRARAAGLDILPVRDVLPGPDGAGGSPNGSA